MHDSKYPDSGNSVPMIWGSTALYHIQKICRYFDLDDTSRLSIRKLIDNAEFLSDKYIQLSEFVEAVEQAERELKFNSLGLQMAIDDLSEDGLEGQMLASSPNLEVALSKVTEYSQLVIPGSVTLFYQSGCQACFGHSFNSAEIQTRESVNAAFMGFISTICRCCCGEDWTPQLACFTFPEPNDISLYEQRFGQNLLFEHKANLIFVGADSLQKPMPAADKQRHMRACSTLNRALKYTPGINNVSQQVLRKIIDLLLNETDENDICLESISKNLQQPLTTMQRKLIRNNTNFRELLELGRYVAAMHYLLSTDYSITEITDRLGYSQASVFTRAFSRWTHLAPNQYRVRFESINSQ